MQLSLPEVWVCVCGEVWRERNQEVREKESSRRCCKNPTNQTKPHKAKTYTKWVKWGSKCIIIYREKTSVTDNMPHNCSFSEKIYILYYILYYKIYKKLYTIFIYTIYTIFIKIYTILLYIYKLYSRVHTKVLCPGQGSMWMHFLIL